MLRFVPDHLKTKKMCKHAVKTLPFVIRYVPDRYKTQQMCNKVCKKWWNVEVVPECYKDQKICVKAVDTFTFVFDSVPDQYNTQEMCDKVVFKDPFMLNIALIDMRLKKCAIMLFPKILLC